MPLTIEMIADPELGGFTARVPDIPAYGEGETEDEAVADLKEALRGYIEAFGLDDALARNTSGWHCSDTFATGKPPRAAACPCHPINRTSVFAIVHS